MIIWYSQEKESGNQSQVVSQDQNQTTDFNACPFWGIAGVEMVIVMMKPTFLNVDMTTKIAAKCIVTELCVKIASVTLLMKQTS